MSFDYTASLLAVVTALKDYNAVGVAVNILSAGLSCSISNDNIIASDPETDLSVLRADRLPAVYVMIARKEEDPETMGRTGSTGVQKRAVVEYEIVGIYGKSGGWKPHAGLLTDIYKLAGNIEGVFQAEVKLSNTALWCNPATTEFSPATEIGEGFAKAVLVRLEATYLFR